jgi:hypothetical protein
MTDWTPIEKLGRLTPDRPCGELRVYAKLLRFERLLSDLTEVQSAPQLLRYVLTAYVERATNRPHHGAVISLIADARSGTYGETTHKLWRRRNFERINQHLSVVIDCWSHWAAPQKGSAPRVRRAVCSLFSIGEPWPNRGPMRRHTPSPNTKLVSAGSLPLNSAYRTRHCATSTFAASSKSSESAAPGISTAKIWTTGFRRTRKTRPRVRVEVSSDSPLSARPIETPRVATATSRERTGMRWNAGHPLARTLILN